MVRLKLLQLLLILLLGLGEDAIPMLVEFLVLLDVGVLDFFLALLMLEHELLVLHVEFLLLQLEDAVLGYLSLNVATLLLARLPMLLHCRNEVFDVLSVDLSVLAALVLGIFLL